jgi:hypothetical protein
MVNFMTNSGRIMDDIKEALLGIDHCIAMMKK